MSSATAAAAMASMSFHAVEPHRKRVAVIGTEMRRHSHAQHFIDRLLLGYTWAGEWRIPEVELVSIYMDQFPDGDLVRARAQEHCVTIYPSVAEALTLGTSTLAVDGVLIIGEHGNYPRNDKGQTLYPRYEFFKQVTKVFESSGRSVPIFNDKHLSTEWSKCAEMVAESKRLGFVFMAGSSLPFTRRMPAVDVPTDTPLTESVCAGYGEADSYDFHGLEAAQCMSERRKGGEVGIWRVTALRGEAMWEHAASRPSTVRLLEAALTRSHTLPVELGYLAHAITFEWVRSVFPQAWAYFIEHRDGFHTTLFMLPIQDFNYAGLNGSTGQIISCQMYLPMPLRGSTTADFFNPQIRTVERMVVENAAPNPVERTLLTSGMTLAGVESLHRGERVDTPEMDVRYTAQKESLYWRD
ncbi:MAG: hypothetical protein ACR2IE_10570 [Candidatus Sumerlaeaceae bacterium]